MRKEEHQYKKQIKQGSEMEQVNAADREWKDDNVITQYDNKRTREELRIGFWRMLKERGKEVRLVTDSIMDELLGVDADLPQEEKARRIWKSMVPEEVPRFQRYLTNLLTVGCDEIVCQWIHPQEGIRYIRCSGKCESQDGESYILNGYYQDITELILRKEENRSSARLLENDYLRVSYIDLNQDKIFTLKCVENEREVQDTFTHSVEDLIAGGYVAQEHQEDVVQNLSIDTICRKLEHENKKIRMVYRRKVHGSYQWVESVIIPMEDYSRENARVIWMVKSLDDQKSGAMIIGNEQELIQAHRSLRFQDDVIQALNSIYDTTYYIDLENQTFAELKATEFAHGIAGKGSGLIEELMNYLDQAVAEPYREGVAAFADTTTLDARLGDQKVISHDYLNKEGIWIRASIIPVKWNENGRLSRVLFLGHQIDREKRKELEYQDRLLEAYTEARMANMAKSDFLARMSHDIRTPINGIMGMLEISERYATDVEKLKENRAKARKAAKYLLSLVNDVLDMSKLERSEVQLTEEPFDMNEMLEEVWELLEPMAAESKVNLVIRRSQPLAHAHVIGSPVHVKQMLMNITTNAIKYNRAGGMVAAWVDELGMTDEQIVYRITVEDNGIGMSEEFQKKMFEPFARETEGYQSEYQGTGLGMSIVKKILDKMHGTIEVYSRKNEGSRFVVTVPFQIDTQKKVHFMEKECAEAPVQGKQILLVEDNELNLEIATFFLEEDGAIVTPARNGKEAVELFQKNPDKFDLILMDIMMPVMDGYQAARAIRQLDHQRAGKIPVIAMTANAFAEDVVKAKKAGMNDHIAKPLDRKKMRAVLAKYIEK